ncbi:class I SAM-dependent methyltransferase [Streptomyces sp. NPDC005962]|uniref:class I SAM-dependent methyltransferase n=1 Tax=Streptomyces sp. NPDC005962 TaxID=3154466 RepID=UPI0033D5C33D
MTAHRIAPEVMTFYASTIDESTRLSSTADGRLEMVRTQELLRRHLPPAPARILDVGGGPGTHARWLIEDGYEVHLVDPVPRHVEQARCIDGCVAELGDARELAAEKESYDVVLLFGPLYHLLERADRDQALAEAWRVLRPGGLFAAAGINRYASLFEHTAYAHLHGERMRESIRGILRTQVHDGKKAFTAAYFHSGAQLLEEVTAAGFDAQVFGIEGPTWAMLKATEQYSGDSLVDTPLFQSALAAARLAEPYPELLAASSHLLAVGRR